MVKGYIIDIVKGTEVSKIRKALSTSPEIKSFTFDESSWVLIVESQRNVDNLVMYAVENIGKGILRTKLSKRDLKMVQNHVARKLNQSLPRGWEVNDY